MPIESANEAKLGFLLGGGEMGERIGAFDWSKTSLGRIDAWPAELRRAVQICLESRHPIVLYWGADFILLYNDAWIPIVGGKHPAALGRSAREVWAEIRNEFGVLLEGVYATGQATWCADQLLPLDRYGFTEECYFSYSLSPVRDDQGRVCGLFTAVTETTLRVVAERRIRTLRELAEQTVEARTEEEVLLAGTRVFEGNPYDVPFSLQYAIKGDCATLKASSGMIDSQLRLLKTINLTSNAALPIAAVLSKKEPVRIESFGDCAHMSGGAWPEVSRAAFVQAVSDGNPSNTAILITGISPRRPFDDDYRAFFQLVAGHIGTGLGRARAFEAEKKRAEALSEIDRAKTTFFSNVSHEFRTPLTLMLGPLQEMLSDSGPLAPHQLERVKTAHRNTLRLLKLVNSLLDFSRIEAGRMKACYEPVDLAALTIELASNFRSAMEAAHLEFIVDCPPLSQPVYVDREMWEKIALNLLSNALKFTFEGNVTVSMIAQRDGAVLTVADTGVGIPESELPRIFERFHRVEGTNVEGAKGRTYEGTGIGLALIQEFVKLHGGTVTVRSRLGEGSTFMVFVPFGSAHLPPDRVGAVNQASTAVQAEAFTGEALSWTAPVFLESPSKSAVAQPRPRPEVSQRFRVLVADDNADMREHLSHILAPEYDVVTVPDGGAALQEARREPPDLILSDVMMPYLDGFAFLQVVRADPVTATIPIILLSARAGEESKVQGMEAGADDYLSKPFSARELLARVRAHLEMANLRKRMEDRLRAHTAALYELMQSLAKARHLPDILAASAERIHSTLGLRIAAFLLTRTGHLEAKLEPPGIKLDSTMRLAIKEKFHSAVETGSRQRDGSYLPLRTAQRAIGIILLTPDGSEPNVGATDEIILQAMVGQVALAIERAELEEQAREAEVLRKADELQRNLLNSISHSLRAPLAAILSALNPIAEGQEADSNSIIGLARIAHEEAYRLDSLIGNLLDMSRLEAGALKVKREPHDIQDVIGSALRELQNPQDRKILVEVQPELPLVWVDFLLIVNVLVNLLDNAIKYSPADLPVSIDASLAGNEIELRVSDRGSGVPVEEREVIFGKFARGSATSQTPGIGLGLPVSKGFVEAHEGRIWVEDRPGGGSIFCLTLPLFNA